MSRYVRASATGAARARLVFEAMTKQHQREEAGDKREGAPEDLMASRWYWCGEKEGGEAEALPSAIFAGPGRGG